MPLRRQNSLPAPKPIHDFYSYDYACFEDPTFEDNGQFKGVRFNDTVGSLDRKVSEEDLSLLWYSRDDYDSMQLSNVDLWRCTKLSGFEGYDLDASDLKNELQARHIKSVLALQKDHKAAGMKDADGLKTFSLALSKESTKEARLRAEKDSIDVFRRNKKSPYVKASSAKEYARKTRLLRPLSRSKSMI